MKPSHARLSALHRAGEVAVYQLQDDAPRRSAGDDAIDRGLKPWVQRPGRRVATTLGPARGQRQGEPADDAVVRALSPGARPLRRRVKAASFRPLPRLGPRESGGKRFTFLMLAFAIAGLTAAGTAVLSPTISDVPVALQRVPHVERVVQPALAALAVIGVHASATLLAGSFAAALAAVVAGALLVGGLAIGPAGVLATLGVALTLAWWRRGRWFTGAVAGMCVGAAAGWNDDAVWVLALPMIAALFAWPWRRPLVGLTRVASVPAVALLATATIWWLRFEEPAAAVEHGRSLAMTLRPTTWPTVPELSPWLAAPALLGLAAIASRSLRAAVYVAAWAAAAWVGAAIPVLPALLAAAAAAVAGVGVSATSKWRGVWHPLAAGGLTAMLLLALRPEVVPQAAAFEDREALAAAVAALVPAAAEVVVPEGAGELSASLRRRAVAVVLPAEAAGASYVLAPASERRRLEREAGVGAADRGAVLLRYHEQAGDAGVGRQWVLLEVRR